MGACRRGHERGGEQVGVEHEQLRRELAAQLEQSVDHERRPDLAEQPRDEVGLDPGRVEPVAGHAPGAGAKGAEPLRKSRRHGPKAKPAGGHGLLDLGATRDDDLVAALSEGLRQRQERQDVSCLWYAAEDDSHSAPKAQRH